MDTLSAIISIVGFLITLFVGIILALINHTLKTYDANLTRVEKKTDCIDSKLKKVTLIVSLCHPEKVYPLLERQSPVKLKPGDNHELVKAITEYLDSKEESTCQENTPG